MKTKKSVVGKILIYLFLILLALLFLVPVFYVMYNSLLPKRYIGSFVMPSLWSLDNYKELFSEFPIMKWYGNTAISTVAVVLGNIFFTPLAGYGLAKLRFPGRKVIFICLMLSMMIPGQLVLLPQYIMMAKMGLVNTLLAIILPYLSQSMFIFMSRQFFYGIPEELEEAARIDGLAGSEPISGLSCQSQECCWQPSLFLILPARGTRTWYLPRLSAHRRNMFWW